MKNTNTLTLHAVAIESAQSLKAMSEIKKGMEGQQEELDLLKSSISDHVMIAARPYGLDFDTFKKEYKEECLWLKSKEGVKETGIELNGKIPRHFIQANSDIRKGMELGINPNDHTTYYAFKQAKLEAAKEKKKEDGDKEEGKGGNILQGDDNSLSQPVSTLLFLLKGVTEENYGKAVAVIEATIKDIQTLVDVVPVVPKKRKEKVSKQALAVSSDQNQAATA